MLYTHENVALPCRVFDVDTKEEIKHVAEVNPKAGWLKVHEHPLRLDGHGQVASKRIRFRSIHAIKGLEGAPCLFHCYGRLHAD